MFSTDSYTYIARGTSTCLVRASKPYNTLSKPYLRLKKTNYCRRISYTSNIIELVETTSYKVLNTF